MLVQLVLMPDAATVLIDFVSYSVYSVFHPDVTKGVNQIQQAAPSEPNQAAPSAEAGR